MPLRTAVYIRRSSEDHDEKQIHSIERQEEDLTRYFEKQLKVEDSLHRLEANPERDFYREDASSKKPGRPQFNLMLEEIRKNRYDVLLCTDLTRLSRNAIDSGALVQLLEDEHLKEIRTLDKAFTTIPTDKFTLALFLAVSKYENDQRALNTVSGIQNQKRKGKTTHKAPMGYVNKGEKKGERWVEADEDNFDKARRIWDLFLIGNYTIDVLRDTAKDIGLTYASRQIRNFPSSQTIRYMLSNPYYMGKILLNDKRSGAEGWIKGEHPAMVTEEEFAKAQMILAKNGYKHAKLNKAVDIIEIIKTLAVSGIYTRKNAKGEEVRVPMVYEEKFRYKCNHCGHRYFSASKSPCSKCSTEVDASTSVEHMQRFAHLLDDGSKKDSIKFELILDALKQALSTLYVSPALFEVLRKRLYTLWVEKNKQQAKMRKEFKKRLEKLEDERDDFYRKQNRPEGPPDGIQFAIRRVLKDIEEWKGKLEQLADKMEEDFERAWQRLQVLNDAKEILSPEMDFEPKKRLLLSLTSNIVIYKDKIEVEWQKPFGELAKAGLAKKQGGGGPTQCLSKNLNGSRLEPLLRTLFVYPGIVEEPLIRALKYNTWREETHLIKRELSASDRSSHFGKEHCESLMI